MSIRYAGIGWTRFKKSYDSILAALLALFLISFVGTTLLLRPEVTVETLLIRGTSLAAFCLLHVILCIGPLARMNRRFLPLLFNRRHLGVAMFLLALTHAIVAVIQFHSFSRANPLVSIFTAYSRDYTSFVSHPADLAHFPFEPMGFLALIILFLMAATSHDFWLKNLGASLWKTLHLMILPGYGLVAAHVAWGFLQSERNPGYLVMLGVGMALVLGLHGAAGWKEWRADRCRTPIEREGFVRACRLDELAEETGHVAWANDQRIALFRTGGRVFAVSNTCRHQGGPLGEGRVLDGCITCPWHGWQYRAGDGTSPPPFQERVETYRVRTEGDFVYVNPRPDAPGTPQEGAPADLKSPSLALSEFFVGYLPRTPPRIAAFLHRFAAALMVCAVGAGLALASLQGALGGGEFEFGTKHDYQGLLLNSPIPLLRPPASDREVGRGPHPLLLVGEGKSGLPKWAERHAGEEVRFRGTLIHRGSDAMVEMNDPESFHVVGPSSGGSPAAPETGTYALAGELVDTKCWLGVMRPSTGKVHRACAVRCLAGGVPPGLAVRGEDGKEHLVLLAGPGGRKLEFDPQWAGRTVRAVGVFQQEGTLSILRAASLELTDPTP